MAAVPVVAPAGVAGPVAVETDKDESAVVVRPEVAECERRTPVVADWMAAIRPGNPVEYPVRRIMVTIIVIKASERGWIIIIA
jgi:hypothetical protein